MIRWTQPIPRPLRTPAPPRAPGAGPFAREIVRWLPRIVLLAVATGSVVALFLWSLDEATRLRFEHPWLLWLLPAGGVVVAWLYQRAGGESERGNNLIITALHEPATTPIPARMAPLVLAGTVITHLFGGSAGREGTAVQIGGALAGGFSRRLRLAPGEFRLLVMLGIAAGFGAVFGTPFAGAVFAVEVGTLGRLDVRAFLPALAAALIADATTRAWGIEHTHYAITGVAEPAGWLPVAPLLLAKVCLAGAAFGLAATLFAEAAHLAARTVRRLVRSPLLRPVLGALIVIALAGLLGSRDYLGLGVSNPEPAATTLLSSFEPDGASPLAWLWKTLFTAITLGSGFKGGEVTPLYFVGASLGNALAGVLDAPTGLLAGAGLVAVFGAAANTPLASTVMGVELFGPGQAVYLAAACFVARAIGGHGGIYLAQRVHRAHAPAHEPDAGGKGSR